MSQSRAAVFARGALQKGLVSREQAEECLALLRRAKKRGRSPAIEHVFVRKGYLTQAEAAGIVRRLRPRSDELELAPEVPECPSCGRDPGEGEDCFRCGAILATGSPGPRATACGSCGQVVLLGTALCPSCARPVDAPPRRRRRRGGAGKRLIDRLILLATLGGMGYFLYLHGFQEPETGEAPAPASTAAHPALAEAEAALRGGKRAEAVQVLQDALSRAEGEQARELRRALVLVAEGAVAERLAEQGLEKGEDPALRVRLAELSLAAGRADQACAQLERVPRQGRSDAVWRLEARARRAKGDEDWVDSALHVHGRKAEEGRELALALTARGRKHLKNKRLPQALKDLRRARQVDADLPVAHFALGLTLLELGELDDARVSLRHAIQLDSAPAEPWLALGLVMERLDNPKAARANYQQFLRLTKDQEGQAERVAAVEKRLNALAPE